MFSKIKLYDMFWIYFSIHLSITKSYAFFTEIISLYYFMSKYRSYTSIIGVYSLHNSKIVS